MNISLPERSRSLWTDKSRPAATAAQGIRARADPRGRKAQGRGAAEDLLLEGLSGDESKLTRKDWSDIAQELWHWCERNGSDKRGLQTRRARRDLVNALRLSGGDAGLDTADRFLANADRSFTELAEQPAMGSPLRTV